MNKILIDIIMYIFESLLLIYYANTLFTPRKSKTLCITVWFIVNFILCAIYQISSVYINGICLMLFYILMFYFLYDISFKTAVFHTAIFLIVMIATEIIVMSVGVLFFNDFNAMDNENRAYLYVVVLSKIFYFAIIMIVLKLFAIKQKTQSNNKYFWLLFFVPFSNVLMLIAFRYDLYYVQLPKQLNILFSISIICMLFSNILVFVIYEYSIKNENNYFLLQKEYDKNQTDINYYEILEKQNEELKMYAHDAKKHLLTIKDINENPEISSVFKYYV